MEGDLLGIDFGQATSPNQTAQSLQSSFPGVLQLQPHSTPDPFFGGLPSPAVAQQPPPVVAQLPLVQLAPPPAVAQLRLAQLTPPPAVAQLPLVQLAPPPAVAQLPLAQLTPPPAVAHQALPVVAQLSSAQLVPPPSLQQPAEPAPLIQSPTQHCQQSEVQQHPTVGLQQHPSPVEQPVHQPNNPSSPVESPVDAQYAANVHKIVETIWKPSPTQNEPTDPILREIKERFGGRWKLARSDPYDEYLKAAGVGIFARKLAIAGPLEQHIEVKGINIHIDFHSTFSNQINVFRLEESVENLVEKSRQSVFCSYKDGKLTLLMTPLEPGMNRTQEIQRYINEQGELVLIYTCGTATCRRYFFKLPDLMLSLNIVG